MRRAFTLVELIFVIVILTIVGALSLAQISHTYESFVSQRSNDELEMQTKIVLEQIASRFSSAIKESIVLTSSGKTCIKALSAANGDESNIISWVSASKEGLNGLWNGSYNMPALSGFVDLTASSDTNIITPSSNANYANTIIDKLSYSNASATSAALYFGNDGVDACSAFFGGASKMYKINSFIDNNITISSATVSQYYKASWSAYAFEYNATDKTLWLYYNFRPWINSNMGTPQLMAKNVGGFGVKYESGLIRINICLEKDINGISAKTCNEKAIF